MTELVATDYNSLVSCIQHYVEDTGEEFTQLIPNVIRNACRTIVREVDVTGFNVITSVTAIGGVPTATLATDSYVIKSVAKTSAGRKKFLLHRPYTYLVELWPTVDVGGGNPTYYTRLDNNSIYLAPTPTSTQELEVRVVTVSIPTSDNPNCYLLDMYPGLLLSRCLVEANMIKKDMPDANVWGQFYDRERQAVENEAKRNRRDDGFQPISGVHFENTLKGTE